MLKVVEGPSKQLQEQRTEKLPLVMLQEVACCMSEIEGKKYGLEVQNVILDFEGVDCLTFRIRQVVLMKITMVSK
ncbi:uncharacterized protein [Procambarus clarkii]|uniref:uncharacterized protein n=1 Tax=Procambarus clarkii TaxID=6728 RepID=UPI003741F69D